MEYSFSSSLKENANIVDIISQYVDVQRSGSTIKACCPFHKEKTPSFVINESKQFYKCFGCGKSGDVYSFIQDIENVDFVDAVKILADKLGVEVPTEKAYDSKSAKLLKEIKDINLYAARYYYKSLIQSDVALEYLKNRKVLPETIKSFGLGYASLGDELIIDLQQNFSIEAIQQSGIATIRNDRLTPIFRNRLIFPIINTRGEVIAFGGRQLDSKFGPKYINSPETKIYSKKNNLYGLNIARKHLQENTIFLVEGYMDVISMHQNGYKNTVASLGTAFTIEQANIVGKLATNVFILYDSDNAGITATMKALTILLDVGIDARVIQLGNVKDPDDFFNQYPAKDFERRVDNSQSYIGFNLHQIANKYELSTNFGKDAFAKESVTFVKKYKDHSHFRQTQIEESIYFIAEKSGYTIKTIGTEIVGPYFSVKQFADNAPDKISFEQELDFEIEEEIDKKELIILEGLKAKIITSSDVAIQDLVYRKNRMLYYWITANYPIELDVDETKNLNREDYLLLIKSIKNTKLNMRIEYLEKVQSQFLSLPNAKNTNLALILGAYIIKLKKSKV